MVSASCSTTIAVFPFNYFNLKNASINNLNNISPRFLINGLNVVTGVSGAGKSSLIKQTLIPVLSGTYNKQLNAHGNPSISGVEFSQLIYVDRSSIGKTARSTPVTYTKLFDLVRDLFASLDESKKRKYSKSTFSFNVIGGRCETCEGAGKLEVGMHFMGNVEKRCPTCEGKRFKREVLEIKYKEKNISDILSLSVKQAHSFFIGKLKIQHYLEVLISIGLGYIKLGQSSNSLSGGEAQRIKLATEIIRSRTGNKLYVFDEPTTGLHFNDINVLMHLFENLLLKGNTIIAIEHNPDFIKKANHITDLGPGSAEQGGEVVFEGNYEEFQFAKNSITNKYIHHIPKIEPDKLKEYQQNEISFTGITTNNLKSIDVHIPENKHIVITGKSGSGKSSLAFDTIFAEAQNRFIESFPSYVRRFTGKMSQAKFETVQGLTPALALKQGNKISDPRSTLGTLTEVFDLYRLLFARYGISENDNKNILPARKASHFSFNNSEGSCSKCSGLGYVLSSDFFKLLKNPALSFENGALKNHKSLQFYTDPFGQYVATLHTVGMQNNIDYNLPVKSLNQNAIDLALFGTGDIQYNVNWNFNRKGRTGNHQFTGIWKGFVILLLEEYFRKHANGKGDDLKELLLEKECPDCDGKRFNADILDIHFVGHSIFSITELSITESIGLFSAIQSSPEKLGLSKTFGKEQEQILTDISGKLKGLDALGLGYLNINRQSKTLSGGELQRVLLSTYLKGGLSGLTYVLDEPSTGLHISDTQKLNDVINQLVSEGNTVVTVEHNPEIIKHADYILEIGPEAGMNGGLITAKGFIEEIKKGSSETAKLLFEKIDINPLFNSEEKNWIQINQAYAHNLKNINVGLRKNSLNVITGVSGSGKTSLVRDVLIPSFSGKIPVNCKNIHGIESFRFINWINKSSVAGNVQSTPATYTGVFDYIRKLFAQTDLAKSQKLKAGDFSFNSKSGQCPACKGHGYTKVVLDFISDVESVCETCSGRRYRSPILEIKFNGLGIDDVLNLSINEAVDFFSDQKSIKQILDILSAIGLGYIKLGQSSSTLSGGEVQRLKIARAILSKETESGMFIFDEPSRGLHPTDLHFLTNLFEILLKNNNSVVVIEHNPKIICQANHVIDLGPGGGEFGGELIYQGSPKGLLGCQTSKTGKYLRN